MANGENDSFGMSMAIPAAEIVVTAAELPIMGSASERIGGAAVETVAVDLIVADVLNEAGADTVVGITDHASHEMKEVKGCSERSGPLYLWSFELLCGGRASQLAGESRDEEARCECDA